MIEPAKFATACRFALALSATLSLGCGLVDDRGAAASWCNEEEFGDIAEVTIGQRLEDGVLVDTDVALWDAEGRIRAAIYYPQDGDSGPRQIEFTRDAAGNVIEQTQDEGADGTLEEIRTTTYDDEGRPTILSIDEGNDGALDSIGIWDYSTPGQDNYTWDADADGDADSLSIETYSESGQVVQRTYDLDADGDVDRTYTYSYSESGLPLAETEDDDDYSAVTTYEYDSEDRLVRQILTQYLPSMFVIEDTYEYDDTGLLTTVETDWNEDGDAEEVWRATYDGDGRVIRAEVRDGSGELQSVREVEYDEGLEWVRSSSDSDGDGVWDSVSTRAACD